MNICLFTIAYLLVNYQDLGMWPVIFVYHTMHTLLSNCSGFTINILSNK